MSEGPSIYKSLPKGENPLSKRTPDHYKDYLLRYLESNEDQIERTELLQQLLLLKDMGIQFEYGTKARYEPKLDKVIMTNTKQAHTRFSDLFRNYLKPVKAEPAGAGQRR